MAGKSPDSLPEFLRLSVRQGLVDEAIAKQVAHLYSGERAAAAAGTEEDYRPSLLGSAPDPLMTFDTLVPFRANAFATDLARVVAEDGGARALYNPLYCYAEVGLGKTHLLSAIASAASSRDALLLNIADAEAEYDRAVRLRRLPELRSWIMGHGLLLVDDVQLCEGNELLQKELFATINLMMKQRKSVVFSSDVPPTQLRGIEERLVSRFGGGPIVALQMGEVSEREQLIRSFLGADALPPDVTRYIAENAADSVRSLKAAAVQVQAVAKQGQVRATVELARSFVSRPGDRSASSRAGDAPSPSRPPVDRALDAERFKMMLSLAESEGEQSLALQIALSERLRQLNRQRASRELAKRIEETIDLLRDGQLREALRRMQG